MNIREAFRHKDIFAPAIRKPVSFNAWMSFLSALFALPMSDAEAAIFRSCTARATLPTEPFNEAWLICGRRSGKSFMMALIAVYLATFRDYKPYLALGERATVMVVAADRKQARVVIRYMRAMLNLPVFAKMIMRETAENFELNNSIMLEVTTASIRAVRGYAIPVAIVDEVAFLPKEENASPDYEILDSIRPAMAQFPNSLMLCAGSPYARRGAQWEAFSSYYGRDDASALVWRAPTRVMNPTVPQKVIDDAFNRDASSARAEWMAEFRSDIESYLSREIVEAARVLGRFELPRLAKTNYVGFVDPSGGAADEMTLCIAHKEGEIIVIDCIRAVKPPFSPDSVVSEFALTLKSYGVHRVSGDRYGGEWPAERFRVHGIRYDPAEKPKSDLYRDAVPIFSARRVELLDHPKLIAQLIGLERRTARSGRDSIDHAPNSHDDIANAVCGAMTLTASPRKHMIITDEMLAKSHMPGPYHQPRSFF